jgi:FkbM family methyltransferase
MVNIHPPFVAHPLIVRMQSSSDPDAFDEIFVGGELEFSRSLNCTVRLILDLGANVGYASIFFLNAFPDSFVLAVEPDGTNAEICRQNLAPYGNRAKVLEGAVWHRVTQLRLVRGAFGDGREWATQVRDVEPGEMGDIPAWDIPGLLEFCQGGTIDLLKIDIEGSEIALFSKNTDLWLDRVRNLCIETHGPDCEFAFRHALESYDYEFRVCGEWVSSCLNLKPKIANRFSASR